MYNMKLFENYTMTYSVENVFNIKLINNYSASEYDINEALLSIGYAYQLPLSNLENIFMTMYQKSSSSAKRSTIHLFEEFMINVKKSYNNRKTNTVNLFDENIISIKTNK